MLFELSSIEIELARAFGIVVASFASEDLSCITAGMMARTGRIYLLTALLSSFCGIFLGDLGLFALGKALRHGFCKFSFIPKRFANALHHNSQTISKEKWHLIILARFVPGMRLPVYLGTGFLDYSFKRILLLLLLANLIWTPALVLISYHTGAGFLKLVEPWLGSSWLGLLAAATLLYLCFYLLSLLLSRPRRRKLALACRKLLLPEFWPPILFYTPLVPGWLYWLLYYRGFHTITASNPGIEHSGIIGESKSAILAGLPSAWTLDWILIPSAKELQLRSTDSSALRWNFFQKEWGKRNWSFPAIFKPDQGQRGIGVKLIQSKEEAKAYICSLEQSLIVQLYHPGPWEAGIFYYRMPCYENKSSPAGTKEGVPLARHAHKNEACGHIFSITHKAFPVVTGDGSSTVQELIDKHPRYRFQAAQFYKRHASHLKRVLAPQEKFPLAIAGNHAQGVMFLDGSHLYSEALRRRIDEIAKSFPGFYFGRFDVRYSSPEELRAGRAFRILELNGATSESTNIYDPSFSLARIYKTLYKQWALLFAIAHKNRQGGVPPSCSQLALLQLCWSYKKQQKAPALSD